MAAQRCADRRFSQNRMLQSAALRRTQSPTPEARNGPPVGRIRPKTKAEMTSPAGRINRLFGTDGGVMLSLYPAFPADFDPAATPLLVTIDALEVPLWCDRFERRGMAGANVEFADFDTSRRAEELVGRILYMAEDEESDDEFYMEDLIGFAIEAGELRGTVTDYYDSDMNPLFGIDFGDGERLIPAAEEFIARIDFDRRRIRMILPDGLAEL